MIKINVMDESVANSFFAYNFIYNVLFDNFTSNFDTEFASEFWKQLMNFASV